MTLIDENLISVNKLSVEYVKAGIQLLATDNVSFDVKCGENVSIVGPSGSGKTTILRALGGLVQPTSGTILIDDLTVQEFHQRGSIGFVFQRPLLFPWRTVLQNVLLPCEIAGERDVDRSRDRAKSILATLGLEGFENSFPRQLSGGMLQRVAVARALIMSPKILILDEPFSALDEITREELWLELGPIWRHNNITVILVTHSIREAVFLGDRVIVLSARPAKIVGDHTIELPMDRDLAVLSSHSLEEQCNIIRLELEYKQ